MIIVTGSSGYIGNFLRKKKSNFLFYSTNSKSRNTIFIENYKHLPSANTIIYLSDNANVDYYEKLNLIELKKKISKIKKILKKNKFNKIIYISSSLLYKKTNKKINNYCYFKSEIEKYIIEQKGIVLRTATVVGKPLKKDTLVYKIKKNPKLINLNQRNKLKELVHINDLIELIFISIKKEQTSGIFKVCSNYSFNIEGLVNFFKNKSSLKISSYQKSKNRIRTKSLILTKKTFDWEPSYNEEKLLNKI